jgi:hypothetical protein
VPGAALAAQNDLLRRLWPQHSGVGVPRVTYPVSSGRAARILDFVVIFVFGCASPQVHRGQRGRRCGPAPKARVNRDVAEVGVGLRRRDGGAQVRPQPAQPVVRQPDRHSLQERFEVLDPGQPDRVTKPAVRTEIVPADHAYDHAVIDAAHRRPAHPAHHGLGVHRLQRDPVATQRRPAPSAQRRRIPVGFRIG